MQNYTFHAIKTQMPLWLSSWILLLLDCLAGFIAFHSILRPFFLVTGLNTISGLFLFAVIQGGWGLVLFFSGLYSGDPTSPRFSEIQKLFRITFTAVVLIVFTGAVWPHYNPAPADVLFRYWLIFMAIATPLRLQFRTFQKRLLRKGIGRRRTVIVGINPRGLKANREIVNHDQQGYEVIGFIRCSDDPDQPPPAGITVLGSENELNRVILENQVAEVVLAFAKPEHFQLMTAIDRINGTPVSIKIVPDLYEVISGLARTRQLYGLPLIAVNPNLNTVYHRIFKRTLDAIAAVIGLIVLAPFWAILAAAIKLDSPGPVLYQQTRIGLHNRQFKIYKFRSMVQNAEAHTGPVWAAEDDDRITKIGRWMRRFRIDEVPQLLNVLQGDMSLVGPRPERPHFVDRLIQEYPFYHRRHRVRPGISGWSQIKHPYDNDIEDVRQKLKYDFYYIESIGFMFDLTIILNTIWVVISGKGR
ncbi:MAG: sugar transferase [Candidatus Neomarinimicrobiota bacterium]